MVGAKTTYLIGVDRKLVEYSNLKFFKALTFAQIKVVQLDGNFIKCFFNGYSEGMKIINPFM